MSVPENYNITSVPIFTLLISGRQFYVVDILKRLVFNFLNSCLMTKLKQPINYIKLNKNTILANVIIIFFFFRA